MTKLLPRRFNPLRVSVSLAVLIGVGAAVGWQLGLWTIPLSRPPANSLIVISPYWHNGTWVFDDDRVGLVREPFVAGMPEMIDVLVADIPNFREGFRLLFSAEPFPGYQQKLTWIRGDMQGNWYRIDDPPMEGWICPAMFHYFEKAPPELYVKAEPL